MNVLVLSGPNHRFNESADVIYDFLKDADDLSVTLEDGLKETYDWYAKNGPTKGRFNPYYTGENND